MSSFPAAFIHRLRRQMNDADALLDALKTDAPTSVRHNPLKQKSNFIGELIPWCDDGLMLKERPYFTADPLLHAGAYYPQEACSMFTGYVLKQLSLDENIIILDACAAPGGKSTHLSSIVAENGILVSNEPILQRASILKENIIKWGMANTIVTSSDPSAFSKQNELFDIIVIDAPCGGEGMFRKDERAINEWSENNSAHCSLRQQRIVQDLLPSLKENGYIIYSTCTFNPEENEKNIQRFCKENEIESVKINIPSEWTIEENTEQGIYSYHFYPHKIKGEGFFLSVLQKRKGIAAKHFSSSKKRKWLNEKHPASSFIKLPEQVLFEDAGIIHSTTENILQLSDQLSSSVKIIYSSTPIAEIKNEKIIPLHELAMHCYLNKDTFNQLELSLHDAQQFLSRNDFKIEAQKGRYLVTYLHQPLGWINHLESRFNNLYPVNWRIRKLQQQSPS